MVLKVYFFNGFHTFRTVQFLRGFWICSENLTFLSFKIQFSEYTKLKAQKPTQIKYIF